MVVGKKRGGGRENIEKGRTTHEQGRTLVNLRVHGVVQLRVGRSVLQQTVPFNNFWDAVAAMVTLTRHKRAP